MADFLSQIELTKDSELKKRIRMAAVTAAVLISGEDPTGITPSRYAKRQALAHTVITTALQGSWGEPSGEEMHVMFVWAVCQNQAITHESSDSDIQFTVNSVWDDCAGVTGAETP